MINTYFEQIEKLLSVFPYVVSIETRFEAIDIDRGYFRIKIILIDQSELYLFEYIEIVNNTAKALKYRYHWQDKDSKLLVRWDNAPHHPEIQTFPNHVHDGAEANVKPSAKPDISTVLLKISELIESGRK